MPEHSKSASVSRLLSRVSGLEVEAVFADLQGRDKVHILDKGDI